VFVKYGNCFKDILATPVPQGTGLSWRKEILPVQWKVALSALSSYLIFQLANPMLFRYRGPAEAGRMGMSTRVVDTLLNLANSWVSTKSAPFGTYIARKDYATLDAVFRKAARQAIAVFLLGCAAFLVVYFAMRMKGASLAARFLDPLAILFLLGSGMVNCIVFCQAIYLRAHKQEPFLYNSLVGAVLVPLVIYVLGRPYGGSGIAAGLFALNLLIGLPWATCIFLRKRKQWHSNG
jgi:O-antigen/teichoic acid export membrane protein